MRSRLNKIFLSIFVLLAVIMSGCQTQSRGAQDEDYLYFLFANAAAQSCHLAASQRRVRTGLYGPWHQI